LGEPSLEDVKVFDCWFFLLVEDASYVVHDLAVKVCNVGQQKFGAYGSLHSNVHVEERQNECVDGLGVCGMWPVAVDELLECPLNDRVYVRVQADGSFDDSLSSRSLPLLAYVPIFILKSNPSGLVARPVTTSELHHPEITAEAAV